jgi:Sulfotransferase domain
LADTHGLVGEGICSAQQNIFCKTHWPERRGCVKYKAHRAILLIRNPWDAMDSYWNLNVTNTHTKKVTDQVYQDHYKFYQDLIRNEMQIWLAFHKFWMAHKIPILLVRYEDLMEHPQRELERILMFASRPNCQLPKSTTATTTINTTTGDASAPDSCFWSKHIAAAIQSGSSHGYQRRPNQPKQSTGETPAAPTTATTAAATSITSSINTPTPKIGRSLRRYPDELIQELHGYDEQNDNLLLQLGYHVHQQGFPQDFYSKYSSSSSSTNLAASISTPSVPVRGTYTTPTIRNGNSCTVRSSSTRLKSTSSSSSSSSLEINQPVELRPPNCPYGRLMRDWRRARTKDDTEPFPTVGE